MKRIQFYPTPELAQRLESEALNLGVSISTLVVDLLNEHFCLVNKNKYTESQLTKMVFDELKAYVTNPQNVNSEFDILKASETFKTIEMTFDGKPSTIRAKIGKAFSKQIGSGKAFPQVQRAYNSKGKLKKSVNNATMYKIEAEEK